jgi:phosphoserine phosphatase RsbU/P
VSDADETTGDKTMIRMVVKSEEAVPAYGHFLIYEQDGETIRVALAGEMSIGRVAPSEIVIPNPEISRLHCRIRLQGDWALLSDLGSTNGTYVDGQRLERPARLQDGSRLNLGSFLLRYERRELAALAQEAELQADLQRAEAYVRAILPAPLNEGPVLADWHFTPSAKLGGDAFGYQFLESGIFAGFLLDVSGHGIGSAMHAANVANSLRRRGLPGVDFADPAQVAAGLNAMFPMEEHNGLMLTIWVFAYDPVTRSLRFCAAGHHPSFLVTPEAPDPAPLWLKGPAIGMLPFGKWANGEAEMPPGAVLTIFSDGVFEILDREGRQWGLEDFRALVATLPDPAALYQAVRAAARPGPLDDDFSVLQLRFA